MTTSESLQAPAFRIKFEDHHPRAAADDIFERIISRATAETVPSGILLRTSLAVSHLATLDGSEDAAAIDQTEFEICVDELADSRLPATDFQLDGSNVARERAAAHRESGLVPIFVGSYRYHAIRNRVWVGLSRVDDSHPVDVTESDERVFEERRAFLASTLLPGRFAGFAPLSPIHFGQSLRFVVPADGFLGNGPTLERFQIDFGDGQGFRDVQIDEPVEVKYASPGVKTITLRADDGTATASFRLAVEEDIVERLRRDYDVSIISIPGRVHGPDGLARAEGLIINRKGAGIFKPVLMVEGFPFHYPWNDLFRYANQENFALDLVGRGYTVVLVRFTTGPKSIQASAFALVELIKVVLERRIGDEPLVVGGFSMGGLVARFALTYMEHPESKEPPHQTGKFFTVDTPHEGANVSVAVQGLVQVEDPGGEQATLMRSVAARQALLHWVPAFDGWRDDLTLGANELRARFLAELARWGSMPKKPDTIAVANGSGNGRFNQAAPAAFAVGYACERKFWANLFFADRYPPQTVLVMRRRHLFDWRVYRIESIIETPGLDSVPGGIWEQPIFRRVHDRTAGAIRRDLAVANGSFIPTVSALGIVVDDYYRPLTIDDLNRSYFKKVTYHQGQPDNEVHVRLTPQLVGFLRQHVFGI